LVASVAPLVLGADDAAVLHAEAVGEALGDGGFKVFERPRFVGRPLGHADEDPSRLLFSRREAGKDGVSRVVVVVPEEPIDGFDADVLGVVLEERCDCGSEPRVVKLLGELNESDLLLWVSPVAVVRLLEDLGEKLGELLAT
jgi:hypothetical protein